MLQNLTKNCICFLKKETVLAIATTLALSSTFFIPPSRSYVDYIDWNTLALLFGLMTVMKGFQNAGMFDYMGSLLLQKTATTKQMLSVLVFLPFVCSTFITNDVSLLTFVPFAIIVVRMAGQEKLLIPLVVMQTAAANLGSMLTPMGNPQNLYLYSKSGMSFLEFCNLMLPYVLLSAVCLGLMIFSCKDSKISEVNLNITLGDKKSLLNYFLAFCLCMLGIFDIIPPILVAIIIAGFLLIMDRSVLVQVDYSLLGTFFAFFIFVGNMGRIEAFQDFLESILAGHETLVAVLTSQVISNVPAALLLSGFTGKWGELIIGCNLGGLGTLIASMASLISYKLVVREYPDEKGRYFLWFTACNLGLLAILLVVGRMCI